MKTVWKYELGIHDEQTISMPSGAEILFVGEQHEKICLWARVDPDQPPADYHIFIAGTGHNVPSDAAYIGSVIMMKGHLVFHVFSGIVERRT